MTDIHTPEQRSRNMAAIRAENTKPEMVVRRLVHSMGYRYRLHRKDLPGKPDLTFPKLKKVIFVHGCYWHMHRCKRGRSTPKSNAKFWREKRSSNVLRDRKNRRNLRKIGWDVLVVWECQTRNIQSVRARVDNFLSERAT